MVQATVVEVVDVVVAIALYRSPFLEVELPAVVEWVVVEQVADFVATRSEHFCRDEYIWKNAVVKCHSSNILTLILSQLLTYLLFL